MEAPDLLMVCLAALTAVFVLLGLLALVMRGLITVFPAPRPTDVSDPVIVAAIAAAATAAYPGATVTKIEETR